MESSRRVTKFIYIGIVAMDMMASAVVDCGASVSSSEFFKVAGRGIK